MPPARILLLGANGQVGTALRRALPPLGEVGALDRTGADLSQPERLREVVRMHRPSIIVNAGAYTAVDKAESDEALAFAVNATAPGILAEEAEALGACLVHYSTDYVYDGRKGEPYVETDATNPQSVYGRSKLAGEDTVRRACRRHLIFRTSWVFAASGGNFLKTMLRLAAERDSLRVVSDQIGAPTSAELIAACTVVALGEMAGKPAADPRWGTYHLAASGSVSWHGYARHVIARAQARGAVLRASPESVAAIPAVEYPTPAARPANSRLDTLKLRRAFQAASLPDWRDGVDSVVDQLVPPGSR